MSFRRLILALILIVSVCPARAQDGTPVRLALDRLLAPKSKLDPEAIYQLAPRWNFALSGDISHTNYSQEQDFSLPFTRQDDQGETVVEYYPGSVSYNMDAGVVRSIGFQAGYGGLGLSFSKKLRGEGINSSFSFDYLSAGYALSVQLFNVSSPVEYNISLGEDHPEYLIPLSGMTKDPGKMRALIVDSFYACNRRNFVYSAAYKGGILQRKSSGSWIFGIKVFMEEFGIDPSEEIARLTSGFALQNCVQASFGAGYSQNVVVFHRQPTGDREAHLRNLTLNFTAIPLVTLFNQFTSTAYTAEGGGYVPTLKSTVNGRPKFNYVYRAGLAYTHGLLTFNLYASNDKYSFTGVASAQADESKTKPINTTGLFSRQTVTLRLCKRF